MRSLRRALLAWLLPPLLIVGAVAAFGAYVFMDRRLNTAFDQDLGDIARALVPHLHVNEGGRVVLTINRQAEAVLKADSEAQIFYAVLDDEGRLIAGDPALPLPPRPVRGTPLFWNDQRAGRKVRVAALRAYVTGVPVLVISAETTYKRERAARDAMFSAIVPVTLLSIASIAGVLFGVRRGLGPVERLREELDARSHVDLSPVVENHVVEELRPMVHGLNEMLARLESAQNTQARFIANAAHQLRTPIAGLLTQLDLARSDGGKRDMYLANAREGAARLARLAQQVLSLAAADPISNPVNRDEACDLAEIVREHADIWLRAAGDVEFEFDLEPAPIHGNKLLVAELASNLVDNAARYGGKTVTVGTRRDAGRSILSVSDDGPGIPPAERTRIFERFHRLDNHATEGSGLGLAIVAEIAQRHDASIAVSDTPDAPSGTRVEVSFPAA